MKKSLFYCLITFVSINTFSQTTLKWKGNIEARKVFIENKGQFDGSDKIQNSEILFGTDESPTMIYFTKNGLTYSITKTEIEKPGYDENEKEDGTEEHKATVKTDILHMQWLNANTDVKVIPIETSNAYYNYSVAGKNISHVNAYKKLVYQNLYPGIDVEYVFHAKGGIEYSFILYPGADISKVKMKYSGNTDISNDENGNVYFSTLFGDIIDHAPVTYYQSNANNSISSKFKIEGNIVSLDLAAYDKTKTVVVDPWTVMPNMPVYNSVFYIKSDALGNAYIYGGDAPFKLQKYDTAGLLAWTYITSWNTSSHWFGALLTDRRGNSYITNGDGATFAKIDSAGNFVWSHTSGSTFGTTMEYWAMAFNCSQTQVYIGGTNITPLAFDFRGTIFKMNMTDGSINNNVSVVHPTLSISNEVRSLCSSPDGNIYYLSLDTVGSVSPSLAINYGRGSSYAFPYYLPYSNAGGAQGQNNMCAFDKYLFTTDGATLHKRDVVTGAILASAVIPSGSANNNSGVAVDSCGNIYVGGQTKVCKYDSSLNFILSANTSSPVFDVSVGNNGDVFACGQGYAVALNMDACGQYVPNCCSASTTIHSDEEIICSGDSTQICAPAGLATYMWNTGETTPCIEAKVGGNYYVSVSDGGSCSGVSNHLSLAVYPLPPVSISVNGDTLTAYNAVGYQWYLNGVVINGATSNSYIAHQTGNYTVAITDSNGCVATSTKVNLVTGISNLNINDEVKVYPNPSSTDLWHVEVSDNLIGARVEIFDDNGRIVYKSEISSRNSDMDLKLAKGIYIMRINSNDKQNIVKLIKL